MSVPGRPYQRPTNDEGVTWLEQLEDESREDEEEGGEE